MRLDSRRDISEDQVHIHHSYFPRSKDLYISTFELLMNPNQNASSLSFSFFVIIIFIFKNSYYDKDTLVEDKTLESYSQYNYRFEDQAEHLHDCYKIVLAKDDQQIEINFIYTSQCVYAQIQSFLSPNNLDPILNQSIKQYHKFNNILSELDLSTEKINISKYNFFRIWTKFPNRRVLIIILNTMNYLIFISNNLRYAIYFKSLMKNVYIFLYSNIIKLYFVDHTSQYLSNHISQFDQFQFKD
ncbi:unnamed protein product [Paramecium octaurelia]|uniref:Transmembrane protein n=1 Tax=Paramecium octaurelia TaxID=43137 RepID=A0A8S1T6M4_PAROT|nr:unnamed protein product [Paramecium octaurelia]